LLYITKVMRSTKDQLDDCSSQSLTVRRAISVAYLKSKP
jgi:hypothetical protein